MTVYCYYALFLHVVSVYISVCVKPTFRKNNLNRDYSITLLLALCSGVVKFIYQGSLSCHLPHHLFPSRVYENNYKSQLQPASTSTELKNSVKPAGLGSVLLQNNQILCNRFQIWKLSHSCSVASKEKLKSTERNDYSGYNHTLRHADALTPLLPFSLT